MEVIEDTFEEALKRLLFILLSGELQKSISYLVDTKNAKKLVRVIDLLDELEYVDSNT